MRSTDTAVCALCAVLAMVGCARRYDRHEARVDAYLNPAYQVSRQDIFCFVPAAEAHPEGSLPKRQRYDELANICARVGQSKGVRIFAERVEGCLPTRLDWWVAGSVGATFPAPAAELSDPHLLASNAPLAALQVPPAPPPNWHMLHNQPPPSPPPQPPPPYQDPFRHEGRSRRAFRKGLLLSVRQPNGGAALVEAGAVMWSDLDAFTDDTAQVLCRALMQDFPSRVNNRPYTVVLDRK